MFLVVWEPISPDAFHTKFTPSYERTDVKQTITCAADKFFIPNVGVYENQPYYRHAFDNLS